MKIENLFSVAGKTVVITGGSRGIGEMIARAYVDNGANVILTSRKASDVEGLAAALGTGGAGDPRRSVADGRDRAFCCRGRPAHVPASMYCSTMPGRPGARGSTISRRAAGTR